MINWLLSQLLPLTVLLAGLLLLRPVALKMLGARWLYSCWLAVPLLLLASFLPLAELLPVSDLITRVQVTANNISRLWPGEQSPFNGLALLWLIGVLGLLLLLLGQYRQIRQQLNTAQDLPAIGTVRCKQSPALQGPYISGFWRATVLLPVDFQQRFDQEQQQLVLQHEIAHWQRGDLHANVLALCILLLFWFHPLCWLAYRAYRQDQELACDALVLQHARVRQKVAYSYALLSNAQSAASNWQLLSNHYGDKQMLKQRLNQLQQQHGYSKSALLLTMSLLLGAVSCLQLPALAGGTQETPIAVSRVEPVYPEQVAKNGMEGYVVAKFDIAADGSVHNVNIIKSVPMLAFDQEVVQALRQWRYSKTSAGQKNVLVQLDFALEPAKYDIERVEVLPAH